MYDVILSLFHKTVFIERMIHDYSSKLPKNRINFAHIFDGTLILPTDKGVGVYMEYVV